MPDSTGVAGGASTEWGGGQARQALWEPRWMLASANGHTGPVFPVTCFRQRKHLTVLLQCHILVTVLIAASPPGSSRGSVTALSITGHLFLSSDLYCARSSMVSTNPIRWDSNCAHVIDGLQFYSQVLIYLLSKDNKRHDTNVLGVQCLKLHTLLQILVLLHLDTPMSPFSYV